MPCWCHLPPQLIDGYPAKTDHRPSLVVVLCYHQPSHNTFAETVSVSCWSTHGIVYYGKGHVIQLLDKILHQWDCCNTQFVLFTILMAGHGHYLLGPGHADFELPGKSGDNGWSYQVQPLAQIPPYQLGAVDPPCRTRAPHQWCYRPLPEGSDGPIQVFETLKLAFWGADDACWSSNHRWMCILQPLYTYPKSTETSDFSLGMSILAVTNLRRKNLSIPTETERFRISTQILTLGLHWVSLRRCRNSFGKLKQDFQCRKDL